MATKAVLYARKSTEELEGRSVSQQLSDLETFAKAEGWEIEARFTETASAYAERTRPKFSKAMEVAEGIGGVLLVWALDRFSRKGAEDVLRLFPRTGKAPFRLVSLDGVDTARKEARFETIIKAELALQESERMGSRIRRARADARARGLWASGNAPYGYEVEGSGNSRRLAVQPEARDVVRRMASEVVDGSSFRAVARGLNGDGILSPQGKAWHPSTVRAILTNPATAGFLPRGTNAADTVEKRVTSFVKDGDGSPVVPGWEALISPEDWYELTAKILARKRSGTSKGGRPAKERVGPTLLGGVLKCSACGRSMAARRYKTDRYQYVCGSPSPVPGLQHVTAEMAAADDWVTRAVVKRLAVLASEDPKGSAVKAVARAWSALTGEEASIPERLAVETLIADTEATVERTARMAAEGLIPEDVARGMLTEYRETLEAANARLAGMVDSPHNYLGGLLDLAQSADDPEADPIGPGTAWAALGVEEQRTVIGAVVERVELQPGKVGGRYSPEEWAARFVVSWA